jgi:hypothetical protein
VQALKLRALCCAVCTVCLQVTAATQVRRLATFAPRAPSLREELWRTASPVPLATRALQERAAFTNVSGHHRPALSANGHPRMLCPLTNALATQALVRRLMDAILNCPNGQQNCEESPAESPVSLAAGLLAGQIASLLCSWHVHQHTLHWQHGRNPHTGVLLDAYADPFPV